MSRDHRKDQWLLMLSREGNCRCWICGFDHCVPSQRWLEIHHIERRSHAPQTYDDPCNWFLACNTCHAGPLATMPHAEQLAHKLANDRDNYDREKWLRLRDPELKAPERVTEEDVNEHFQRLYPGRYLREAVIE